MKNILFFSLTAMYIFTSCTTPNNLVDTSCPGYKSPDFDRVNISEKGIGIMPVLGGDEKEQYRRPMGDAIFKHFQNAFGANQVKSTTHVIRTLNDQGLSQEYTTAISNYAISGIVPREVVLKLGDALGVNYLLYTRLLANSEVDILDTHDGYGNTYTKSIKVDEVYIQCQVWDTNLGDVVWEGKSGIAKFSGNPSDFIDLTASGLVKVVGNERNDGPCQTKKTLLDGYYESIGKTYIAILGLTAVMSSILLLIMYVTI